MNRTMKRTLLILVGGHLALWLVLSLISLTIGLSDQSPSFLLVLAVYWLDLPARWLLESVGKSGAVQEGWLFVVGTIQWAVIAVFLATLISWIRGHGVPAAPVDSARLN